MPVLSFSEDLPYRLTQTDAEILAGLNQTHYLTAAQLSRLLYTGRDADRYSQRRLKRLVDAVLRLRALPRVGPAPHVFYALKPRAARPDGAGRRDHELLRTLL